jgi:gliding motility-associated-like protein
MYYNTNSGTGEIYAFHVDNPSSCKIVGSLYYRGSGGGGTRLNSMTVDKDGIIYCALYESGSIIRFNPRTREVVNLGNMPIWPSGDLIFYRDKLFMVSNQSGIYEVNLNDVPGSKVYIPAAEFNSVIIYGLIAVPKDCNENSIYAISAFGDFIELDFNTRKATGKQFKLPLSIYDAASGVEDGNTQGVFINRVEIKAPCTSSENTADIRILASTADTGRLSYALNGGTAQTGNFFEKVPMGTHTFRITNRRGCFKDTVINVTRGLTSFSKFDKTGPLNCTVLNGTIVAEATSTYLPVKYAINAGAYGPAGIFSNLSANPYSIKAIDNGGCTIDSMVSLAFRERPDFYNTTIVNPTICLSKTGRLEILLNGSNAGITTQINQLPVTSSLIHTGLDSGNYRVSIIKNGDCRIDTFVTIPATNDARPNIGISLNNQLCFASNGSIALQIEGNDTPYRVNFNNQGFSDNLNFNALPPGNYPIVISNKNDCRWDTSAIIIPYVMQPFSILVDSVQPTCANFRGGQIDFSITGNQGPYKIISSTAESFIGSGTIGNLSEGSYLFHVSNADGCPVDSFYVSLTVADIENCTVLYVPNAFTPNNDGLNDIFKPKYGVRDTDIHFSVFNRFGEQVFITTDRTAGWDGSYKGKKQASGSYIWKVTLVDVSGKKQIHKGTVTIIR